MKSARRAPLPRSLSPLLALALVVSACSDAGSGAATAAGGSAADKPVVQTVNYPLAYFAERIGGDRVDVRFRAPGDGDPAFWAPTEDDIAALQAADLILLNGANYAKWRTGVSLPESKTVDTSAAFADAFIEGTAAATHTHGDDGDHAHSGTAFTTWIDVSQSARQADAVCAALVALVPAAESEFTRNAAALAKDLAALDADLETAAKAIGSRPLVASHPVYQYFARRYELAVEAVLWEPETVPDADAMAGLQKLLENHAAKWMLWEGEPAAESVAKLDALGVRSVVFDPCGNRPDRGDWLSVMRANADNLKAIAR